MAILGPRDDRPAPAGPQRSEGCRKPTFLLRDAKPLAAAEKSRLPALRESIGAQPASLGHFRPSRGRTGGGQDSRGDDAETIGPRQGATVALPLCRHSASCRSPRSPRHRQGQGRFIRLGFAIRTADAAWKKAANDTERNAAVFIRSAQRIDSVFGTEVQRTRRRRASDLARSVDRRRAPTAARRHVSAVPAICLRVSDRHRSSGEDPTGLREPPSRGE
jgi:hypothetical protein